MPITSKTAPIYKLGIALESNYEFNTPFTALTLIENKGAKLELFSLKGSVKK
jgi:hypothetical protein